MATLFTGTRKASVEEKKSTRAHLVSQEMLAPFKALEKPLLASCPCKECSIEFCSKCTNGPQQIGRHSEEWHSWLCPRISLSAIPTYVEQHKVHGDIAPNVSVLLEPKDMSEEEKDRLHSLRQFWNAHFQFPVRFNCPNLHHST